MDRKRIAAERAARYLRDGMVVGLGTGSTAYWAIREIGRLVRDGLSIRAIATSKQSEAHARRLGIPIVSFAEIDTIDLTIDGADEVDADLQVIKGGGGALLREKIVAGASKELIIIVDDEKPVEQLGKFPLPVEVVPFGFELAVRRLQELGCKPVLRLHEEIPFLTDNGNYTVDCHFGRIEHPIELHTAINRIVGVVDNGLFLNMANRVIIGCSDGAVKEWDKHGDAV
ncbi:ribose-5-phosphate isomerase RpiA [Gorillibacterium timonense]|uniref:ribose-5-phosphate isomerase RpiA n=1 Tax=Gorillibacterium timonense TaxID=1689269 RepID=UPI00071D3413|nr:ribose-5-phosphate isomerase RpiA [Gorillibacterium timonense]